MADVTPPDTWRASAVDHSNAEYGTDPLRLALVQPVAIETEISLADRLQPVAMGTMKTSVPEGISNHGRRCCV